MSGNSLMSGFPAALRAELYVARRSNAARLAVVLPAITATAQLLLAGVRSSSQQAQGALMGAGNDFAIDSAWGYYVDGLLTGLTLMGLVLVAYTAWSFASDRDTGAIRHLLIRRSSRRAVVLAKFVSALLLALIALVLMVSVITATGAWLWDFGPVVEDGYELIGTDEIREELALGLRLALLPIPTAIAFALMVAVLTQSATQAVTTALGLTLALDIFKGSMGTLSQYLYVDYMPSLIDQSYLNDVSRLVRGYSDVLLDPDILQLNQWVPLPQMLLLLGLTLIVVSWRRL